MNAHAWTRNARRLIACAALGLAGLVAQRAAAEEPKSEPIVVGHPARIEVFPTAVKLEGPRREMHLIVTGHYADGGTQDLSSVAEVVSQNPAVATVDRAIVHPAANGSTQVTVKVGGHEVAVPVEISKQEVPATVSFQYGTLAVLSKQGCNMGACHGSPSGKGGFRLSLRAYDPALDIETLVREASNRRTNLMEPEASLILRKPLMEVAHGGGKRLKKSDPLYEVLRDWIAQGCQADPAEAPTCTKLEVYPTQRILMHPAHTQQVMALAHFSDGSVRDVTSLAVFTSSDDSVATVDAGGLVTGLDRGEAAVLVRFLDKLETASVMFLKQVPGFKWSSPAQNNFVDHHVFEKLEQLHILPSELCTD
jgi:hypothetical protein